MVTTTTTTTTTARIIAVVVVVVVVIISMGGVAVSHGQPKRTIRTRLLEDMPNGGVGDEPEEGLLGDGIQLVQKDEQQVHLGRVGVGVAYVEGPDAALLGAPRPPNVELRVPRVRGGLDRVQLVVVLEDLLREEACVDGDHGHGRLPGFGDVEGGRRGRLGRGGRHGGGDAAG